MQLTIIRAFNSSRAHSFLPQLPLSSSRKKERLLTSPEQREVERKSRQAEEQVGVEEKSEWERKSKRKKRRRGLKGFGAYLMMKD